MRLGAEGPLPHCPQKLASVTGSWWLGQRAQEPVCQGWPRQADVAEGHGSHGILWAQGRMAHEGPGDGQAQGAPCLPSP